MTSIQNNIEYDYNTTAIQMGFRRKSNDLFESVTPFGDTYFTFSLSRYNGLETDSFLNIITDF